MYLLSAAGGEGKTTILLQTVRELCKENGWQALILRRPEKDTPLHEEQLLNFTREGNWIIAVDDCSTDNSLEILRDYERRYPDKFYVIASKRK